MQRALLAAIALSLASGCSSEASPAPGEPSPEPPGDALEDATAVLSPDTEPATAQITIHYPTLQGLSVRGDGPLEADVACVPVKTQTSSPACEVAISAFPAGRKTLAFRPYLNGEPARGARYVVSRGESVDIYPHFVREHGELRTLIADFHSSVLEPIEPDNQRVIYAYLPPSYGEDPERRYPVVYMHDGRNLFDAELSITGIEWQVDESADEAWSRTGAFAEVIIIGIDQYVTVSGALRNMRQREYNPTPTALPGGPPAGEEYARMVATELKPKVDELLRTKPGREHTATIGSSIGGAISTWITHKYPEVFGRYASLSPATGIDYPWILSQLTASGPKLLAVYVDAGTRELLQLLPFLQAYRRLGYVDGVDLGSFIEIGGLHREEDWARRLPAALGFLFPDRRVE